MTELKREYAEYTDELNALKKDLNTVISKRAKKAIESEIRVIERIIEKLEFDAYKEKTL